MLSDKFLLKQNLVFWLSKPIRPFFFDKNSKLSLIAKLYIYFIYKTCYTEYASAIWTYSASNKNDSLEIIHFKFCKFALSRVFLLMLLTWWYMVSREEHLFQKVYNC